MLPIIASAGIAIMTTLLVFICFLLIIVILVQKPTGGGLVGAFGGAGGVQDFLGAKMGSKITWFTVILFASFVLLSCILTVVANPNRVTEPAKTPAATTAPAIPSAEKPVVEVPEKAPAASTTAPVTETTP